MYIEDHNPTACSSSLHCRLLNLRVKLKHVNRNYFQHLACTKISQIYTRHNSFSYSLNIIIKEACIYAKNISNITSIIYLLMFTDSHLLSTLFPLWTQFSPPQPDYCDCRLYSHTMAPNSDNPSCSKLPFKTPLLQRRQISEILATLCASFDEG